MGKIKFHMNFGQWMNAIGLAIILINYGIITMIAVLCIMAGMYSINEDKTL